MNEAVWGLIGIGVGWLLNEFSSFIKKEEEDKNLKDNLKILLKSEFLENKNNLNHYFNLITEGVNNVNEESRKDSYVRKLIRNPIPNFSNDAYLSQLPTLGRIFKTNEISSLIGIYGKFSHLQNVYQSIIKKQDDYNETSRLANLSSDNLAKGLAFHSKNHNIADMRDLWDIFVNEKEQISSSNLDEIFNNESDY